jgi:hypothetical protein
MEKLKGRMPVFVPFVLTVCLYVVFYSKIETKPTDAGFWFILAMGISLGILLPHFFQFLKSAKKEDKDH